MGLEEHRKRIDELDEEIIRLINERTSVALEIGKGKASIGKLVFDPKRETQVFRKVLSLNKGPLKDEALKGIYREIISGNYALQQTVENRLLGSGCHLRP